MFHVKQSSTAEDWREGGFGLYLHWPFCESKCPYCDFNSHVAAGIDQPQWRDAYLAEIDRAGAETGGRLLRSVFFGGGTPSLMSPDLVAQIIARVRATWPQENDVEITLEANPGSVEAGRFTGYRDAGVNRVSIGVQSLRDGPLQTLGRKHSAAEARRAVETALRVFTRVSADLIYARQDQTVAAWREELTEALDLGTSHLSLYQLTIEPGTVFAARLDRGGLRGLPDEELSVDLFNLTQELCGAAGLTAYEVSNHARPGQESRHNLIYWSAGDYVGIGPGAHGRVTIDGQRYATEALRAPAEWLEQVRGGTTELPRVALTPLDQAAEYIMMGMRLADGISLARLAKMIGRDLPPALFRDLRDWGMVQTDGDRLFATRPGRLLLNSAIAHLVERIQAGPA